MDDEINDIFQELDAIDGTKFISKEKLVEVGKQEEKNTFHEELQKTETQKWKKRQKDTESAFKIRGNVDKCWRDKTLADWPENDYRVHVSNLPVTATEKDLQRIFGKYKSLARVKIVYDTSGRSKQFGFLSFLDVNDYIDCMTKMDGSYVSTKKIQLKPSNWKDKFVQK